MLLFTNLYIILQSHYFVLELRYSSLLFLQHCLLIFQLIISYFKLFLKLNGMKFKLAISLLLLTKLFLKLSDVCLWKSWIFTIFSQIFFGLVEFLQQKIILFLKKSILLYEILIIKLNETDVKANLFRFDNVLIFTFKFFSQKRVVRNNLFSEL